MDGRSAGIASGSWLTGKDVNGGGSMQTWRSTSMEGWVDARISSGCAGGSHRGSQRLARSVTVSVNAQKYYGLSVQPMGNARGKATWGSWVGVVGSVTPSVGISAAQSGIR